MFTTINIVIVIVEALFITAVGLYISTKLMSRKLITLYTEINRLSMEAQAKDEQLAVEMRNRDMLLSSLEIKISNLTDCQKEIEQIRKTLLEDRLVRAVEDIEDNIDINLLGIWPIVPSLPPLSLNAEMEGIFKSVFSYYKLHSNSVNRASIINELDKTGNINLIHFGGHSSQDGLAINNGSIENIDIVPPEWLVRVIKTYPVRVVILASCSNLSIVDKLFENGVAAVVGFRDEIKDDDTTRFMIFFYRFLASGKSVSHSVDLSLLAIRTDLASSIVVRGDYIFK